MLAREATNSPTGLPAVPGPEAWGLHRFEAPGLAAPFARPLWSANVHPAVLSVAAEGACSSEDAFELSQLGALATVAVDASGGEHLLLSDGLRSIRIDVIEGTAASGVVQLRYHLRGFALLEGPLLSLRRLLALRRTGRFSPLLHPPELRARRWLLMLRAYDALSQGANQREIAAELLSRSAEDRCWRNLAPSIRSQAQRLVRGARQMAGGGYLTLLS